MIRESGLVDGDNVAVRMVPRRPRFPSHRGQRFTRSASIAQYARLGSPWRHRVSKFGRIAAVPHSAAIQIPSRVPATGQIAELEVAGYGYSEKAIRARVATATRGIVEARARRTSLPRNQALRRKSRGPRPSRTGRAPSIHHLGLTRSRRNQAPKVAQRDATGNPFRARRVLNAQTVPQVLMDVLSERKLLLGQSVRDRGISMPSAPRVSPKSEIASPGALKAIFAEPAKFAMRPTPPTDGVGRIVFPLFSL
jgi:hypothetical protein